MMTSTTDTSIPSLCQQYIRCFKNPRVLVASVFFVILFACVVVISIHNIVYYPLGNVIFVIALNIIVICEKFDWSPIRSIFPCCSRTPEDEDALRSDDGDEQEVQPETTTAWANRSMGVTSGEQDNDGVTLVVSTTDASTAPPSYNDIISHDDPPPSYEDFMSRVDVT